MGEVSGGEVLAKMLRSEGVERVFGIIDGTYFGLYSSFPGYDIDLITPRHETSAAHMAGAYARLTGKLGVCIASNGPGVANILPGLVVEQAEGNRVLVITSSRRGGVMYPDRGGAYQCFNQVGVISNIAKWSETVHSFARIPELMRTALRACYTGRPGVVHIDIPEDIMNTKVKTDTNLWQPQSYRLQQAPVASQQQLEQVANLLVAAQTPMIHAGSGVIHAQAYKELRDVTERLQVPVTTSWAARGVLSEELDNAIPMIYIETNNKVRNDADVVLVLGSRLGETDWWGKAPYWSATQKVIQVDLDPMILGANKPAEIAILADIKVFLQQLLEVLESKQTSHQSAKRKEQLAKYATDMEKQRAKLDKQLEDMTAPMNPAHIAKVCQDVFPKESVLVLDGGNTTIWGNFYTKLRQPGSVLSTYKFGMLGAGIAQALGAAVARPNAPVCCIIGDGAMGFHPQEIETAVRNNLQVVYLVVCDKQWGMVKMNQQFAMKPLKTIVKKALDPDETINADLGEIRFDKLAESMGAYGARVSRPEELQPALEKAVESGKCAVIHVDVNPVKHMWAPGLRYFKDMHKEPGGK